MDVGGEHVLANGGYAQSTGGEQNWKQTKVKGHRAVIEYDENSGYKLSVPLGQTSLIVWEAVNFATEQEVMTAANAFDIDGLIKTLGEKIIERLKRNMIMKKLFILSALVLSFAANAQDFNKNLASARTAYSSGNLERCALCHATDA